MGLWDRLLTMANCPAVSGQHPGCSCTEGGPGDPSPVLRAAFVISETRGLVYVPGAAHGCAPGSRPVHLRGSAGGEQGDRSSGSRE